MLQTRRRWGDQLDEDEVLPSPSVTQSGNTKTVVEYYKNDRGETMRKTTKTKVVNVEKKVYEVGGGSLLGSMQLRRAEEQLLVLVFEGEHSRPQQRERKGSSCISMHSLQGTLVYVPPDSRASSSSSQELVPPSTGGQGAQELEAIWGCCQGDPSRQCDSAGEEERTGTADGQHA